MASKLRALYQRRKGRDLFDLWLVLNKSILDVKEMIFIFKKYCEHGGHIITRALFEENLSQKQAHKDFVSDMEPILAKNYSWDFYKALKLVKQQVIDHLPGQEWKGK
jgi:predicted nucleotidyltransferase component of viral defense system